VISRQSRFDTICEGNDVEHRLTKPNHPCTSRQAERMNRTIKDATTKRYHYDSHERLRGHLELFHNAYNYARRLKTLKGLTPAQFLSNAWQSNPELFHDETCHLMAGLNA
jgi:transposase InsO family protein